VLNIFHFLCETLELELFVSYKCIDCMVGAWAGHWATLILRLYQLEKTGTEYFLATTLLPFPWCYRSNLKRQCHEIFDFWFFSLISFSQAPEYTIRAVSIFFENWRRYSQLKVHHRCR
jgi:hypothetical protein